MTNKDYVKIARGIYKLNPEFVDTAGYLMVVNALCDVMQEDNPRFNRGRFLEACGLITSDDGKVSVGTMSY